MRFQLPVLNRRHFLGWATLLTGSAFIPAIQAAGYAHEAPESDEVMVGNTAFVAESGMYKKAT